MIQTLIIRLVLVVCLLGGHVITGTENGSEMIGTPFLSFIDGYITISEARLSSILEPIVVFNKTNNIKVLLSVRNFGICHDVVIKTLEGYGLTWRYTNQFGLLSRIRVDRRIREWPISCIKTIESFGNDSGLVSNVFNIVNDIIGDCILYKPNRFC